MIYRHLAVPLDGSPLSALTVEQAVAYARAAGAAITFVHARPDLAASSDGALLHAMSPRNFAETAAGNARGIVAKAEASARAAGVVCTTVISTTDKPHEAILAAAAAKGCDLIFMSSRGQRGLQRALSGSVVDKVLQATTMPVLVAAIERNRTQSDEERAVAVIKDEHRSLAAVVHGLQEALKRPPVATPLFALLYAMLGYIEAFPEKRHHPKEEAYLFQALRRRTSSCNAVLDELEGQHVAGAAHMQTLRQLLQAWESGLAGAEVNFSETFGQFAQAQWAHMGQEERYVLPSASEHLTPADWSEIAKAFEVNADPRFSADTPFDALYTQLLNLAADHR